MDNIKSVFSIKDLENLSGIKAHTIRIWEKRYNVLQPMRTTTNIRFYDLDSLQKLLNITLLHNHGYKISKISQYPPEKIPELVREIISGKSVKHHAISAFKLAMLNFDQAMFYETYDRLLSEKSFREIFFEVFIPLMNEIGLLWQTNTITPAHEHFISNLIKQKLVINTEQVQKNNPLNNDKVFVLYLPMNEIHELGLMYLNYEILSCGYKSIFLGESIPLENLKDLHKYFDNLVYLTYITVQPSQDDINDYITQVQKEVLKPSSELWLIGRMIAHVDPAIINQQTLLFYSLDEILHKL